MENNGAEQAVSSVAPQSFDEDSPRANANDTGSTPPAEVTAGNTTTSRSVAKKTEKNSGPDQAKSLSVKDVGSNEST